MGKSLRGLMAGCLCLLFVGGLVLPASAEVRAREEINVPFDRVDSGSRQGARSAPPREDVSDEQRRQGPEAAGQIDTVISSRALTLDDLLKRVEALEKENASLKAEIQAVEARQSAAPAAAVMPVAAAPASGSFLRTAAGMDIALYGQLKLDAVYSDSNAVPAGSSTTNGQIVAYNAPRETIATNQANFKAAAVDTRLGLNFKAPDLSDGGKVSGKLETDFNGSSSTTTYTPRLRLAYAQLDYDKWAVNAGQQWDFVAPLSPNVMNSSSLNRAGNLGHRHPAFFLTNKWGEIPGGKLTTRVGFIDSDAPFQQDSGAPVAGAYTAYDTRLFGKALSLGVGGLFGTNSNALLATKTTNSSNIYATTVGLTLTLADWLAFKTEGFTGAKLDSFYGNNSTGVTNTSAGVATSKAVRSTGGFAEMTCKPVKLLETNYGVGVDYGNGDQTFSDRTLVWKSNRTYYTNARYNLGKDVLLGLEYQYIATNWMDGVKGDDNRVQSSVVYKF